MLMLKHCAAFSSLAMITRNGEYDEPMPLAVSFSPLASRSRFRRFFRRFFLLFFSHPCTRPPAYNMTFFVSLPGPLDRFRYHLNLASYC